MHKKNNNKIQNITSTTFIRCGVHQWVKIISFIILKYLCFVGVWCICSVVAKLVYYYTLRCLFMISSKNVLTEALSVGSMESFTSNLIGYSLHFWTNSCAGVGVKPRNVLSSTEIELLCCHFYAILWSCEKCPEKRERE